ncbi:hypothetical protein SARC_00430 [Sphaeroforma arctica JP610]|uniref:Uncharacterized protein n=1 Tax=Sphaeroforma arctica JP610 TaxID=667725 RepID=A0A0L0GGJ6_9EUKA|nr:hypothetical protein SARC_00430 [Sphaeroforma arctica JP610]KNC87448.1 hypothetical protein SARC_00430 [Sphaeroforma arctica JP610]|eukprot:XP_014161350.1 hypothetical protein SARC_00430 [Sphaeroforma arctica JP610]
METHELLQLSSPDVQDAQQRTTARLQNRDNRDVTTNGARDYTHSHPNLQTVLHRGRRRTGHNDSKQRQLLHVSAVDHRHHRVHDTSHALIIVEQHIQGDNTITQDDDFAPLLKATDAHINAILTDDYSNEAPAPENNHGGWEPVAERE